MFCGVSWYNCENIFQYLCVWLYRYESAFSMKPEDRYSTGLGGRKSSWDTMTDNTVEDISTSYSDASGDK